MKYNYSAKQQHIVVEYSLGMITLYSIFLHPFFKLTLTLIVFIRES